ncbi:MAG: hypothetical protein ACW99J_17870 [Candidatus Thorarchaeota archaeon]
MSPHKQIDLKVKLIPRGTGERPAAEIDGEICKPENFCSVRNVYLYLGMIVKICRPKSWLHTGRQTEAEIELWETMDDEDRQHFVPLLGWGKTEDKKIPWVAQPFLKADTIAPTAVQIDTLFSVLDKYGANRDVEADECAYDDEISEFGPEGYGVNCMMYDGMPKVYDWGVNQFTKRDR